MFENNKILWFIVIALFGLSVAILGANDLQGKMSAKRRVGPLPNAKQIIEELKQADLDPFHSMLSKNGGSERSTPVDSSPERAQAKRAEVKETDITPQEPSVSSGLGMEAFLKFFDSSSPESETKGKLSP